MSDPTVSVVRPNSLASGRDAKLDRISHVTIKIGYKHTHGHIPLHKKTKKNERIYRAFRHDEVNSRIYNAYNQMVKNKEVERRNRKRPFSFLHACLSPFIYATFSSTVA